MLQHKIEEDIKEISDPLRPVASAGKKEYAIQFENVSRHYQLHHEAKLTLQDKVINFFKKNNNYEDFWALRNVSFELEKGKTLGIIGKNGAGKSTLLKLATRILEPTSGVVRVNGRISAMLELGTGFHPELSARDNIYLNGAFYGFSRKEMDERYDRIVDFSELGKFIDTPVKHFSSGMYMRLGFAVAITVSPDILIIDEVLSVGDAAFGRKCHQAIEDLKRQSKAMMFVSHSAGEVVRFCDEVIYLEKGEIVARGKPGDVVDEYMMTSMKPSYFTSKLTAQPKTPTPVVGEDSALDKSSALDKGTTLNKTTSLIARDGSALNKPVSKAEPSPTNSFNGNSKGANNGKANKAKANQKSSAVVTSVKNYQITPGIVRLANHWQFNLERNQGNENVDREPSEYYLAVFNPHIVPMDVAMMVYKQHESTPNQQLRAFPVGHFEVPVGQSLLLKLEEALLLNAKWLNLDGNPNMAVELIEFQPGLGSTKVAPATNFTPEHEWFFPFYDVRPHNQCSIKIFNPFKEELEVNLCFANDYSETVREKYPFKCAPFSYLTVDLKEFIENNQGQIALYGALVVQANGPILAERHSLQVASPQQQMVEQAEK